MCVFEERGESAKTANRTQFKRAIEWCSHNRKRLDAFVCYAFDRFARDTTDHHVFKARLAGMGIALRSVTQPTDDTPWGQFAETIAAATAKLDNDLRAMRTVDGMKSANTRGRWTHQAPLGYVNGPRGGPSLLPDPERAPLVASAFERLARGTHSQTDVLRDLRIEGLRTRRGGELPLQSFQALVRNSVYCGRLVRPRWGIDVPGDWEPLVSEDAFDRVQLVLDGRRPTVISRGRLRVRPEFPLKHFTKCGHCGTPLTAEAKKGGRFRYYRCRRRDCSLGTVAAHLVEDGFITLLDSLRPRPEYIRLFREIVLRTHAERHEAQGSERRRLEKRRDELSEQKRVLGRELARGTLDANAYRDLREEIDRDLAEVRVNLGEATTREVDVEGILEFAEELLLDPAKMWRQLSPEKRRVFQTSIFPEGITYDGEVRTHLTASFIADLQAFSGQESRMASRPLPQSNLNGDPLGRSRA